MSNVKCKAMNEAQLLIEYAKAWNNLDVSYLHDILDDDFEYNSQWVFDTMHGKWNYINYLRGKFNSILENISSIPRAEIAYFKYCYSEIDKGCIVLTQKENQCSIIIETKNGKITKANMIGIPSPEGAVRFDYKPR
jgi:ketosteroid isomerase-like protein